MTSIQPKPEERITRLFECHWNMVWDRIWFGCRPARICKTGPRPACTIKNGLCTLPQRS